MEIKIFFCFQCNNISTSKEDIPHDLCRFPFTIGEAYMNFKLKSSLTKWQSFMRWVLKDWDYEIAFLAGIIINVILISHSTLNLKESFIEAFCAGLVLLKLLRK